MVQEVMCFVSDLIQRFLIPPPFCLSLGARSNVPLSENSTEKTQALRVPERHRAVRLRLQAKA